ncbi:TetR/AcrR family transcriptional regulator [Nocardiopsis gilva]
MSTTDGRRAKGERRRRALIEATLRVVERDGASGVTHRTVAREANLPTTATTYYFSGVDDMLTAALAVSMEEDCERLRRITARGGDLLDVRRALAEQMAGIVAAPGRGHLLAEFELCLLAARRLDLRESTEQWKEVLAAFARRFTTDPVRIRLFVGAYEGLLLRALLCDPAPTADEFDVLLRELLPCAGGPPAAG